jgi:hypothetical protein
MEYGASGQDGHHHIEYVQLLNGENAQIAEYQGGKRRWAYRHHGRDFNRYLDGRSAFLIHTRGHKHSQGTPIVACVDGDFTIGQGRGTKTTVLQSAEPDENVSASLVAPPRWGKRLPRLRLPSYASHR